MFRRGLAVACLLLLALAAPAALGNDKCGKTIKIASPGYLTSPSYPHSYPASLKCEWLIQAPDPDEKIMINFNPHFDLEDRECKYDYVEIIDGENALGRSMGKFCGKIAPSQLVSSGPFMFITFVSDYETPGAGFSIRYEIYKTGSECSRNFTASHGVIKSPKFPDKYPNNMECTYIIFAPKMSEIILEFESFELEPDTNPPRGVYCRYDRLEVWDGFPEVGPHIGRYCGQKTPGRIRSSTGILALSFFSDSAIAKEGFTANYTVLQESVAEDFQCNEPLGMESGEIDSDKITVSTQYSTNWSAERSRLNYPENGWTPGEDSIREWVQVDLGLLRFVSGVGTQGAISKETKKKYYVKSYKVDISSNGEDWITLKDGSKHIVGAHVLESFVKKFDELYKVGSIGKECDNLLILVAHLYNFHVVESLLIFDILKKLVGTFSERDIELVLLLLKNVGFLLRKDDALALKELIGEAQNKANNAGKMFLDQSRVRFMLETMLALKNNDMRKIPGYDPEPVEKLRKLQRSRVSNVTSGSATQLRVSLENLLDAEQVGRWWIVGSSWSGVPMIGQSNSSGQPKLPEGKASSKMMALARKQRMNTDIRRNIFCVLMSSEDFLDAFENLLKLGLKDQQEREIVHILIDCCLQEKTYNPFYSFLSAKFCEYDRRFQMTFQFSVWDKFRDLENLTATAFSSLVQLLVQLLKSKSLQLSVFKAIEFSELNKTKVSFLRQVLYKLLMETEAEDLSLIFGRVSDKPKLAMMREGLKLFITHFLLKNARAQKSAEEASLLQERAALASSALQAKDSRLKL